MAKDDDLHERFGEILKEIPEAEDALRAWQKKQNDEARQRILADIHERRRRAAYDSDD
jgi:hypothetical protein